MDELSNNFYLKESLKSMVSYFIFMIIQESDIEEWKGFNKLIVDFLIECGYKFNLKLTTSKLNVVSSEIRPKEFLVCKDKDFYSIKIEPHEYKDIEFKDINYIYDDLIEPIRKYWE